MNLGQAVFLSAQMRIVLGASDAQIELRMTEIEGPHDRQAVLSVRWAGKKRRELQISGGGQGGTYRTVATASNLSQ